MEDKRKNQKSSMAMIISNLQNREILLDTLEKALNYNQETSELILKNKYFQSKVKIVPFDFVNWRGADLMDFECIIVLADDLKSEELEKTHEITSAISSLEPEIKLALINSKKGDDYDLEKFYNKAKGFIEVVVTDLDSFRWSDELLKTYKNNQDENEGVLRILEALENCVWSDRQEIEIKVEEKKIKVELKEIENDNQSVGI